MSSSTDRLLPLKLLVIMAAGWVHRDQSTLIAYLVEEIAVLRAQLGEQRLRFTDEQRVRLEKKGKALGRAGLKKWASLATPDTILGWYRRLVAKKYTSSSKGQAKGRRQGRPNLEATLANLIVEMAEANPTWGYTRIRQALANLGHAVGRSRIARVLAGHGIDPEPERKERWSTFLKAHWGAVAGADFFTVEVLTVFGLVRYHVFFVIDLATRRVHLAPLVRDPHEDWMKVIVLGMLDAVDGCLLGTRHLILDRDPVFTRSVREILRSSGVNVVRLPARSPNLNAYAERFVRSVRRECLSRVVPLGERHLWKILREYAEHYHHERNHQGLDGRLIDPQDAANSSGVVERRSRLGGLLSYYRCQEAA